MGSRHVNGVAQALYGVYVVPNLSLPCRRAADGALIRSSRIHGTPCGPNKSFSTTALQHAVFQRRQARPQEVRTERWDEEITSKVVYLVDPETTRLLPEPRTRFDLLRSLDRDTHRLVQVGEEIDGLPVVKIVSKKEEFEREKRQKQQVKEKKKIESASKSLKTLELNWAMDPNDLGHRLDKVAEFLNEGRKVEVILASKKKGRKASPEECEGVLRKIRQTAEGVNGAKEAKQMEGKLGGFATLFFHGKPVQQSATQAQG